MPFNLFNALMPREEAFTDLFCEQSKTINAAAHQLHLLVSGEGSIEERCASIQRIEGEADGIARSIFVAANRTFNAPFDRENILGLAHDLDDVVDLIEEAAIEIHRYEITYFSSEMRALATAVVKAAEPIGEAIPLLARITREHRRILELCERIGHIEDEADRSFDAGLNRLRARLKSGEIEILEYLDRKEVYEHLEAVVDKCDDVANMIETITAKHV